MNRPKTVFRLLILNSILRYSTEGRYSSGPLASFSQSLNLLLLPSLLHSLTHSKSQRDLPNRTANREHRLLVIMWS